MFLQLFYNTCTATAKFRRRMGLLTPRYAETFLMLPLFQGSRGVESAG